MKCQTKCNKNQFLNWLFDKTNTICNLLVKMKKQKKKKKEMNQ